MRTDAPMIVGGRLRSVSLMHATTHGRRSSSSQPGSLPSSSGTAASSVDIVLGTPFMRNVYSVMAYRNPSTFENQTATTSDDDDEADEGASMSEREEDALELPVVSAEREWDVPVALLWSRCSR